MSHKIKTSIIVAVGLLCSWIIFISILLLSNGSTTTISMSVSVPMKNPVLTLPEGFFSTPEVFEGNEVLYHLNLENTRENIRGYFQIISTGTDLEEYLETAEKYKAADIDRFKSFHGDRHSSIIWEYTTPESYVRSFFIKKEQHIYTLVLSTDINTGSAEKLEYYFKEITDNLVI
ncbi:MAG: hypothetical protein E7388_05715 [Ruminococcaceae bacterium]|nr:hypothetical protein [Oscillospiraceae bacterium]